MAGILVPYDGGKTSEKALSHAVSLLKDDESLILLYVIPSALRVEFEALPPDTTVANAHSLINNAIENMKQRGVKAVGVVREGDIVEEIVKLASELACRLIVMGFKERSVEKIGRFQLGSLAEGVAKRASMPVLIIK
jgi:nucleotide-binding universal stress UspA family protein